MEKRGFGEVETWIFDLDNTLYPASCRLFDQIDLRMGTFIAELLGVDRAAAKAVQKDYFYRYGTTLRGLMLEHDVPPDAFLDYVHDIDHSPIPADEPLARALETLPGRKLIFTNGTVAHAEKVLARLGVGGHFTGIFDIVHSEFIPKPQLEPYEKFVAVHAIEPQRAAMFEDIARNLEIPHRLGMTTVLVTCPDNADSNLLNAQAGSTMHHVDHVTEDLAGFLSRIEGASAGEQEQRRKASVAASAQDSAVEAGQGCAASVTPRLKHNRPAE
jgi:putative hydrolase of the HAD superfamily